MAVYAMATLGVMAVTGAAGIPGGFAQLDQAYERACALCRQARWNLHRAKQLDKLTKAADDLNKNFFAPADNIARTSLQNWKLSSTVLEVDDAIFYVNVAITSIIMIVYVLLAWFCLIRKRNTLQEAFEAVQNIQIAKS